jgi:hypothetical protein
MDFQVINEVGNLTKRSPALQNMKISSLFFPDHFCPLWIRIRNIDPYTIPVHVCMMRSFKYKYIPVRYLKHIFLFCLSTVKVVEVRVDRTPSNYVYPITVSSFLVLGCAIFFLLLWGVLWYLNSKSQREYL